MARIRILLSFALVLGLFAFVDRLSAATPTPEQAFKFMPVQKGIEYDTPAPQDMAKCKVSYLKNTGGPSGWLVEDPNGKILRRFLDTSGKNVVDIWCYYKDGIEVYRDIDSNYNGKTDEYRWFNTAGTRWGIDKNEDGVIESWKSISAEEVTAEVVAAVANHDFDRFARVALTAEELNDLGLGKTKNTELSEKIAKLKSEFQQLAAKQKSVNPQTTWEQFSGNRPGVVPKGTDDSTKDLRVYENVVAIAQTDGKHVQMQIGTLVQVGDCWKTIDTPRELNDSADGVAGGFFFRSSNRNELANNANGGNDEIQRLLAKLEKLDKSMSKGATPDQQATYLSQRTDLLEQIADASKTNDERAEWLRQFTDSILQMGNSPEAIERLQKKYEALQKSDADKNIVAYVKFRHMTAANILAWQGKNPDPAKIQAEWLKGLEEFVKEYPTSPDAAEALLQLAFGDESTGNEDEAVKKYKQIEKEFPDSSAGQKAIGARTRLESEGKPIRFASQTLNGKPLKLSDPAFKGKSILLQFWSSTSDAAKRDMPVLKELMTKYGKNFVIIGVSLDYDRKELEKYLTENKLPWPQVFEPGGLDSPPANQLGILTVPTMMLIDPQGKVVSKNIQATDVEAELKKILR
jgi:thiol-disulfide isomerase/thioredoxin